MSTAGCTLLIPNALGLHLRAAATFARTAGQFDSRITVQFGRKTVDAKSTIGLITLGACQDGEVAVTADGNDAAAAIQAIEALFHRSFAEASVA